MISMLEKLKALIEMCRPFNCLMAAFSTFIGFIVSINSIKFNFNIFFLMLSAFLVCAGGQTINDVFDFEIDKKIRPTKVLPSGKITKKQALIFSFILFFLGIIIAFFVGLIQFLIALIFSFLLIIYSIFLTKIKFIGNWLIGLSTAFTLIFGATLGKNYLLVLFFSFSALLANVAREIIKDLEDLEADKGFKVSLPIIFGLKIPKIIVFFLFAIAVFFAFLSATLFHLSFYFVFFMIFVGILFTFSAFLLSKNNLTKAQKISKIAMFFALIAFILSVIK